MMDWALVCIKEDRLPKDKALGGINKPFSYAGQPSNIFELPKSKDVIEAGEILLKTGRTTGETRGR